MTTINRETYERPADMHDTRDPAVLYVRSYLTIRTAVGLLGAVLPVLLWTVDGLTGPWHVRGSLSAYYHSPALDVFVAGLGVVAFLLITYMSGQPGTTDFLWSTIAGTALLGVVFFPTARDPAVAAGGSCAAPDPPGGCSALERAVGEATSNGVHAACAVIFIASLALISLGFARREEVHEHNRVAARTHRAMAGLIVLSLAWAAFAQFVHSIDIWRFTPVYAAELVSVYAFSVSWLLKGWDLRPPPFRPATHRPRSKQGPSGLETGDRRGEPDGPGPDGPAPDATGLPARTEPVDEPVPYRDTVRAGSPGPDRPGPCPGPNDGPNDRPPGQRAPDRQRQPVPIARSPGPGAPDRTGRTPSLRALSPSRSCPEHHMPAPLPDPTTRRSP